MTLSSPSRARNQLKSSTFTTMECSDASEALKSIETGLGRPWIRQRSVRDNDGVPFRKYDGDSNVAIRVGGVQDAVDGGGVVRSR